MMLRRKRLRGVVLALRGHQNQGCRFSVGRGGTDLRIDGPAQSVVDATRGLIDSCYYDVLTIIHEIERQQVGTRRCDGCHDVLVGRRPVDRCDHCADDRPLTVRRLHWLEYELFDSPTLIARFN